MRVDDPLITLESDKASMDVPSTAAGTVTSIAVKKGQEVSTGTVIATVSAAERAAAAKSAAPAGEAPAAQAPRRNLRRRKCQPVQTPPARGLLRRKTRRPRGQSRASSPPRLPARSIWSCSARDRAATRRPFAPPISDSR